MEIEKFEILSLDNVSALVTMEIAMYRARIGLFYRSLRIVRRGKPLRKTAFNVRPLTSNYRLCVILAMLLCTSGDIETNPGPTPPGSPMRGNFDEYQQTPNQPQNRGTEGFSFRPPMLASKSQFDILLDQIGGLALQFNNMDTKLTDWKAGIEGKIDLLDKQNAELQGENSKLQETVQVLNGRINELENTAKANNLIFSGVTPKNNEPLADAIRSFLSDAVKLRGAENIKINDAFRLRDQRILVKFAYLFDRDRILEAAKPVKSASWRIKADICQAWHETRKKLAPFYAKAVDDGHRVSVRKDFLVVDGVPYYYDPKTNDIYTRNEKNKR